jgi:hypothetical protein
MLDNVVPSAVRELAAILSTPVPMRRGSVSERSMKCGQKECRCQHDRQARHGPYYSLTRIEGGRTRSRYLIAEQAALARQQVEAGHQFRKKIDAYWEACEEWADAQLQEPDTASSEGGKKGASKRSSKPRLSPK